MATVPSRWPSPGRWSSEVLRSYAQVFFAHSPWVGLLFALATATEPATFASGLLAVVVASLAAKMLHLDGGLRASGYFGYNAFLVGAGIGHCYAGTWLSVSLVAFAATTAVAMTAAARAWLTRQLALPVLSLPFLAVFWLVTWAAPTLELAPADPAFIPVPDAGLAAFLADYARCLGSIVFVPTVSAGAIVATGLLVHSRLASLFALGAFTLLSVVNAALPSPLAPSLFAALAANAMLLSSVVGGVWFLPSRWSAGWACAGVLGCLLVTVGLAQPFVAAGIPILFVPFNLLSLTILLAARERVHDEKPQSVDFLPGSPEQNLEYVLNQRTRFPLCYGVRFQLPFRGRWTCTQGVDGEHTHQGPWRHGLDFQVMGDDGALYSSSATELSSYHGFKLPVLAAAAGVVVKVENDVPDNPIGGMDVVRNWGNVVVLQHGPGLYSLVAHLTRRSIKVKEGQQVAQGEVLGLCGNSGRSPTPHIHFHLQVAPHLGAATLPVWFGDVVRALTDGESLELSHVPVKGDVCRNLEPNSELAERVCPRPGDEWRLQCNAEPETIGVDLDLVGQVRFQSSRQASVTTTRTPQMLVLRDVIGDAGSVLALLRAAIPRLPFEDNGTLLWHDYARLDGLAGLPWFTRLPARLMPQAGLSMRYASHKDGDGLVVDGVSSRTDKHGSPLLRTRVVLDAQVGPRSVLVRHRHGELCAERLPSLTTPALVPSLRPIAPTPISETKESP
jgi:urea transporter